MPTFGHDPGMLLVDDIHIQPYSDESHQSGKEHIHKDKAEGVRNLPRQPGMRKACLAETAELANGDKNELASGDWLWEARHYRRWT